LPVANALRELLEVLERQKLPHDYRIEQVSAAMRRLGFRESIRGSHYKWTRDDVEEPIVIAHRGGKVPEAGMKDLKALFNRLGLM
jgi:predicted RNA binding protein YcfA (HicA-like mRNA interferase family)